VRGGVHVDENIKGGVLRRRGNTQENGQRLAEKPRERGAKELLGVRKMSH